MDTTLLIVVGLLGFLAGVLLTIAATGGDSYRGLGMREAADNRILRAQVRGMADEITRLKSQARSFPHA